jgi:hypothetical protein
MRHALFMSRRVVRRGRRWLAPALLVAFLTPLAAGCGDNGSPTSPQPTTPTPVAPASVRDRLTVADLFGSSPPGVLHNLYYQPIGDVRATSNALCGTLYFAETQMDTTHPDADWRGGGLTLFPAFSLPVVSRDDWLIPSSARSSSRDTGAAGAAGAPGT